MPEPVIINIIQDPEFDDTAESMAFYSPGQALLSGFAGSGAAIPFPGGGQAAQPPVEFADFADDARAAGRLVVNIETGYAFGDGRHATTWLCLKFLLERLEEAGAARRASLSLLDAGAGTGILAITAALAGVRDIDAVELYPHAVRIAERNIRANDCEWIRLHVSDIAGFTPARAYDIVTANMVSDVLTDNMTKLIGLMAPGGVMIASGVSAGRHESMVELYGRSGLSIVRQEDLDGWHGYVLMRDDRKGARV